MAILRMNVDECRSLNEKIRNEKSQLDDQLQQIQNAFNSLIPAKWTAPAANAFLSSITDWDSKAKLESEKLPEFYSRLSITIDNWEQTASRF